MNADFYSDTQTLPSEGMLRSVIGIETGDERRHACPVTNRLCQRVADLFEMEAAVFLPSGSMCNQIAVAVHTNPGDEIICARESHIIFAECGGLAKLSGAMVSPVDAQRGIFSAQQVVSAYRLPSSFAPRSRLVVTEQTSNLGGGAIWPLEEVQSVALQARALGLATHMDGARILNAASASGHSVAEFCKYQDSAWLAFTKGLGCPIGAVLAGSKEFIDEAWHFKRMFGGAMRQTGVLTAMCLYALDNNVDRLCDDHALAQMILGRLADNPIFQSIYPVETNIILARISDQVTLSAAELRDVLAAKGTKVMAVGKKQIRIVTHLDVGTAEANYLVDVLNKYGDSL